MTDAVLSLGVKNAAIIDVDKIELDARFRDMCAANTCGVYGKCWMCPPDVGEIHELMAKIKEYDYALVYQTIGELEDSFDYEGMIEAKKEHKRVSFGIRDAFPSDKVSSYLHISAGGCGVCEVCSKVTNEPCRYPDKAISSLEAYGVNVSKLAALAGMKYINGVNTVTYFGAVLFSL